MSSGSLYYKRDDGVLVPIGSGGGGGSGGGFTFSQDDPPTATKIGDTWYHTATGNSFVWTSDGNSLQWVQFAPGAGSAGSGDGDGGSGFTFVQETTPTPLKLGDTWFDLSTAASGGTSWVAVEEGIAGSELVWVQFAPGIQAPPAVAPPVPWILLTPLLISPWVAYAPPYGPPYYRKVGDMVHVRGLVSGGALGQPICTLPVGYRPLYEPIYVMASAGVNGTTEVRVNTGGTISCPSGGSPTSWVSITLQFSTT